MLLQLAWKNIWRNKKRSSIIILAIAFGLWGGLFSGAVMRGMTESSIATSINNDLGHIQIHKPGYSDERDIKDFIPGGATIEESLQENKAVKMASGRMLIQGIASSPTSSFAIQITGIEPKKESRVTNISQKLIAGSYLESTKRNPALIGKKLAERLGLKLNSKFVLSFQDLHGDITYISCRAVGIFKSASSRFDESRVFLRRSDLMRVLGLATPLVHEIAIRLKNSQQVASATSSLKEKYGSLEVQSWDDIAPELSYLNETMLLYSYFFVLIILLALVFGIINTMLMSVIDRIREFGVLIAVGMKKSRTFSLIILETILLSMSGGVLGILIGFGSISLFSHTGIDLSIIASSLESFGAETMLFPTLPAEMYVILTLMIIVAANIAAVFPAWKATHLVPSEAIRTF